METLMGLIIGVGLSAACGFRVFVPLLGMSIASMTGHIHLSSGFEWMGTWLALISFAVATILEIGTYYLPWIDNLMDAAATPAAIVAGTIMTASMVGDSSPFLKWTLAVIAGGGVSGIVQLGTVALRGVSSATTGGFGNFIVSTIELVGSILTTIFAIVLPVLCLIAVVLICYKMIRRIIASSVYKKLFSATAQP